MQEEKCSKCCLDLKENEFIDGGCCDEKLCSKKQVSCYTKKYIKYQE